MTGSEADGGSRRLVAALALLVLAGVGQEACLLLHAPRVGIAFVAPALAAVLWLWRPRGVALGLLALWLGLQLLLPLHTGGARVSDWLLHYELGLRFAGQPTFALASALPGRTALYHQLVGALLAESAAFPVFQVLATLLNSLWLWPAALLLRDGDVVERDRAAQARLLALGLGPTVVAYVVYPWPWAFAAFFLLAALYLARRPGRVAAAGVGVALGGALLAHPGSLGYVAAAGVYLLVRRRRVVPAALAGAAITMLTLVPWALDVTGGTLTRILTASIVVRQGAGPLAWLATRPLLLAASIIPTTYLQPPPPVELVLQFFVLTLPGALGAAYLVLRPRLRLSEPLVAVALGGALFNWVAWPPNAWATGFLDALYLGVVLALVAAVSAARPRRVEALVSVNMALFALFVVALAAVSFFPPAADPNLALKARYGIRFLADSVGPLPGVALLLAGAAVVLRAHASRLVRARSTT